jgi:hypothetical protein
MQNWSCGTKSLSHVKFWSSVRKVPVNTTHSISDEASQYGLASCFCKCEWRPYALDSLVLHKIFGDSNEPDVLVFVVLVVSSSYKF